MSLPARGEWIEIYLSSWYLMVAGCLSPHGESGLKLTGLQDPQTTGQSLPARGEWIEIAVIPLELNLLDRLSPHGESGLKCP